MNFYHVIKNYAANNLFVKGPVIDHPGPNPIFSRDVEDVTVGGTPLDAAISTYYFADFQLQLVVYQAEFWARVTVNGVHAYYSLTRVQFHFLKNYLVVHVAVVSGVTLSAFMLACLAPMGVLGAATSAIPRLYRMYYRQFVQGGLAVTARELRNTRANAVQQGIAFMRNTVLAAGAVLFNTASFSYNRIGNTLQTIPLYPGPPMGFLPPSNPQPSSFITSLTLLQPIPATVAYRAAVGVPRDYRSVKGKKGVKVAAVPNPNPIPVAQNTATLVYEVEPVLRINSLFGPREVNLRRWFGDKFAIKHMDSTQPGLQFTANSGRFALSWYHTEHFSFPHPIIPIPVVPKLRFGDARKFIIPEKLIREFDVPKLTCSQPDIGVFLQRLDQASRAIKHEYKDINDEFVAIGHNSPHISTPQLVGLNLRLQNNRSKLIEDFLRGH